MNNDQPFQREMLGTFPSTWGTLAVCKHCGLGPKKHGEDGKCLFEASSFEPLRSKVLDEASNGI